MRIACLQFAPEVGDVDNNLSRADDILDRADPEELDLLVLPELAFTGYNFASLSHISPFLEQSDNGISSLWARTTALKHDCTVIAGYPEKVDLADRWPTNPEYYNSAIIVNADGEIIGNYRKTHLYYTDETWALEGPTGFFAGRLPGLPRTAMGICMDINPYRFQTPWDHFEFANHVLESGARLVVVSMAWLTQDDQEEFTSLPHEPDMNTLTYWISRLEPIVRFDSPQEIIVVFANRTGTEGNATYAGTSAVVGIQSGEVRIYGILGRGEKELLVVDTDSTPLAKLVYRPEAGDIPLEEGADYDTTLRDDDAAFKQGMDQGSDISSGASTGFESDDKHGADTDGKEAQSSLSTSDVHQREHTQQFFISPGPLSPTASESHFSVSSLTSSRLYWLPIGQSKSPMVNSRRGTPNEPPRSSEHAFLARRQENRWSIRSDVSVWNNQPGRPRDMAYPLTLSPESTFDTAPSSSRNANREVEQGYAQPDGVRRRNKSSASQRPQQQKRSQTPKRSISATPDALGLHVPYQQADGPSADVNEDPTFTETARWVEATVATVGLSTSRQESRNQQLSHAGTEKTDQRRAASAKPTHVTRGYENNDYTPKDRDYSRKESRRNHADPPILQPVSQSRVSEGASAEPARDIKRPSTDMERRSARNLRREYMHSAQPRNESNANVRTNSRGRQRSSTAPLGQETESPGRPTRHRSAQNSRSRHREPVDLSQFRLIEEYPSPSCPVHGSRSRSRHDRASSRQETSGHGRRRSRAREGTRYREPSQDVSSPPTGPKASSRNSTRRKEKSYTTTAENGSGTTSTANNSRQEPPRSSTVNLRYGPKTPVAMVFVQDTQETPSDSTRAISPLKCVEKGVKTTLARPRSAVW